MDVVAHFEQGADYFVDPSDTRNPFSADVYEDAMGALVTWSYCKRNPTAEWWVLQVNAELDIMKGFNVFEAMDLFGIQFHEKVPKEWEARAGSSKFENPETVERRG